MTILPESTVPFPVAPGKFAAAGSLVFASAPAFVLRTGAGMFARTGLDISLSRTVSGAVIVLYAEPGDFAAAGSPLPTPSPVAPGRRLVFRVGAGTLVVARPSAVLRKGRKIRASYGDS
jgi:hypothetical protein